MSEEFPLVARRITLVSYRLPGEQSSREISVTTRDIQEVLQALPSNVVSFSVYDKLQGEVVVDDQVIHMQATYFNWSPTYYVDAEYIPGDEVIEDEAPVTYNDVLSEGHVALRLSDGSIEFAFAPNMELVSFTG